MLSTFISSKLIMPVMLISLSKSPMFPSIVVKRMIDRYRPEASTVTPGTNKKDGAIDSMLVFQALQVNQFDPVVKLSQCIHRSHYSSLSSCGPKCGF